MNGNCQVFMIFSQIVMKMGEAADPRENQHFDLYMMKKETVSACLYGF